MDELKVIIETLKRVFTQLTVYQSVFFFPETLLYFEKTDSYEIYMHKTHTIIKSKSTNINAHTF